MSEETTTTETDAEPGSGASAEGAAAAEASETASDAGAHVTPPEAHGKAHWWQHTTGGQTYADRYVYPALVPVVSVAVIIFYVINVSRVFLSGEGTIAIVTAAAITVA